MADLNVVLINPEIPQNTGNIGRTCVGLNIPLHIVGKPGFDLDEKALKRAGLDYWPHLDFRLHDNWEKFLLSMEPNADLNFFSTKGKKLIWEKKFSPPTYLVFGCESSGLPKKFYETYKDLLLRIPISSRIRSLNLATSVGIAVFEVARQLGMGE